MEFIFQISNYNDPALDSETAELLRQRLEVKSRETIPGTWKVTDNLNAYTARGTGRERRRTRYRIYGTLLLVLGIFALVPGLTEPKVPSLILIGGIAAAWGVWSLCFRERKSPAPPASCRKEAAELLKVRRETDWKKLQAEVRFDKGGWSVTTMEGESQTPYNSLRGIFESERLWMLVYEKDMALLLQKRDLVSGGAVNFLPYLQERMGT